MIPEQNAWNQGIGLLKEIKVRCPHCGTTMLVKNKKDEHELIINCPKCKMPITVSFTAQAMPAQPAYSSPTRSPERSKKGSKAWLIGVLSGVVVILAGVLVWALLKRNAPRYSVEEENDTSSTEQLQEEDKASSTGQLEDKTFTVNGVQFTMKVVEGGSFMMGATSEQEWEYDEDERPVHEVTVSSFLIGQTEVTQELWEAVMGSNPSSFRGPRHPVEQVSWEECQRFISKLNALTGERFKLPTEAQWEFAARGGNKSRGYKYSGSDNVDAVGWYNYNSSSGTQNVAVLQANELGLYDMSGNVWEWCSDWYGRYKDYSQSDPTGSTSGRFHSYRGGSWRGENRLCRVTNRGDDKPTNRLGNLGLRLAL